MTARGVLVVLAGLGLFGTADAAAHAGQPVPARTTSAPGLAAQFERLSAQAASAREAGRFDEALGLYERALKLRPQWDEGHWYRGTIYYELDRYEEARDEFRRAIAIQEEKAKGKPVANGPAHALKGLCEFRLKAYETALEDLLRARALGVENEELMSAVRYHSAIIMTRLEQYELALVNLQPFSHQGNDSPTVVEAFGLATLRLPLLPAELTGDRREMVLLAGRASFYQSARQTVPARAAFEELVRRYPDSPNVHYAYGVFELGENPDRAIEAFRKELELSPAHVPSMYQIAFEYIKRSDWQAARPWAEKAVELSPSDFVGRRALGQILLEVGEVEPAIAQLERGVTFAPDSPSLRFTLARAYQRAGRADEAAREREEFRRLQQMNRSQQFGEQAVGGVIDEGSPPPR